MPRFPMTYCSQCGADLGPGDHGASHCEDHGLIRYEATRIELHADSARERPLEEPKAGLIVAASYLPGYAVLTVESSPPRTVVVEIDRLVNALQSI